MKSTLLVADITGIVRACCATVVFGLGSASAVGCLKYLIRIGIQGHTIVTLIRNHTVAMKAGTVSAFGQRREARRYTINGYNANPAIKSSRGPQKYVDTNCTDSVVREAIAIANGAPQQTKIHPICHQVVRVYPNTTTAKTSYDRTEHHNAAEYAPNKIRNPDNAQRQLVVPVALSMAEVQSVSVGGEKSVNIQRAFKIATAIATDVFCMFPLHFRGNKRCAPARQIISTNDMNPRISMAR
jgi:hypothetical protein